MDTTTQTSSTENTSENPVTERSALLESRHDMRDAMLMASLAGNLFMVTLWIAMQLTTTYDSAIFGLLK